MTTDNLPTSTSSGALATFGGAEAAKRYAAALMGAAAAASVGGDGKDILKLTKDGLWLFGQDNTPLHDTDLLAVNPASFRHGYIAFESTGNALAVDTEGNPAEYLVPITQPLPVVRDLPELAAPRTAREKPAEWKFQMAFDLAVIDGPNEGSEMVYKPTSRGGLRMCSAIAAEIARRLGDGVTECVPVLDLFADSYQHKTYGRVFTPDFAIVEWQEPADGDAKPERKVAASRVEKQADRAEAASARRAQETTRRTSAAVSRETSSTQGSTAPRETEPSQQSELGDYPADANVAPRRERGLRNRNIQTR